MNKYYKVNADKVFFENFNGESVIVNLNIGNYYSITGIASCIWVNLELGISKYDLIQELINHYPKDSSVIDQDITSFLDKLVHEELIINVDNINHVPLDTNQLPANYIKPTIEIFDDLQELFLLDPVHAVDNNKGWPFKPEEK